MIQGRSCKQYIFRSYTRSAFNETSAKTLMKILSHGSAKKKKKKKTKRFKGLRYILIAAHLNAEVILVVTV